MDRGQSGGLLEAKTETYALNTLLIGRYNSLALSFAHKRKFGATVEIGKLDGHVALGIDLFKTTNYDFPVNMEFAFEFFHYDYHYIGIVSLIVFYDSIQEASKFIPWIAYNYSGGNSVEAGVKYRLKGKLGLVAGAGIEYRTGINANKTILYSLSIGLLMRRVGSNGKQKGRKRR